MAEEVKHSQTDTTGTKEGESLKRLEFVQVGALNALGRVSNLYGYAKEKTGPLKTGVDTMEGTVKSVVGPVYNKFQDVPTELLKYVDRKVDESVTKLDSSVPPVLKQVPAQALSAAQMVPALAKQVPAQALSAAQMVPALAKQIPAQALSAAQMVPALAKQVPAQALSAAQMVPALAKQVPAQALSAALKVPALAQSVVSEMKRAGVVVIVLGIAKGIYTKYEPKAEQCAVSAWKKLNQLPLFPRLAQVVVPTAAYCTEKYNLTVSSTAEKGYRVSSYLPLVPTEKIAKMFNDEVAEPEPSVPAGPEVDAAAVH